MRRKHFAVIGAGLSGLAACFELSQQILAGKDLAITLFDPAPLGCNASGAAAGLLHYYTGAHAKKIHGGEHFLQCSLDLIRQAGGFLEKQVFSSLGILRLAISKQQKEDFEKAAAASDEIRWLDAASCQALCPGTTPHPGIFISQGYVVRTQEYLEGLWKGCQQRGVHWESRRIDSLCELSSYDAVVVAAGAKTPAIAELASLPIKAVKGQALELSWPNSLPTPSCPLNSKAYIIKEPYASSCLVGATFERDYHSESPDKERALQLLMPKILDVYPDLATQPVLSCRAGLRGTLPGRKPQLLRINHNTWVIAGMGSKGLLYHAFYAKKLVEEISF